MFKKLIPILLILSLLVVGCGGGKALGPLKTDNVSGDNGLNNPDDNNGEDGDNGNTGGDDNSSGGDNGEDNNNGSGGDNNNNGSTNPDHVPNYKYYTVRVTDPRAGSKDISVKVDVSSWNINNFSKNNKELGDMFLKKVKSGSQKIKYNNGQVRFYVDSNGDIYLISGGRKVVYKKYIGAVLIKHTDPDYSGIHRKYVVGMLYKVRKKDSRVTEEFEQYSLPEVGEYEVLILNQDKTNVPNTKTIYMDSYKIDTRYDLNPENFYNDLPRIGGYHKRTRLVPQNWRDYIFSN